MEVSQQQVNALDRLKRISRALHRIDEDDCNCQYTDRQQAVRDRREARLEAEGKELAALLGKQFYHQSDPRGCAVSLVDLSVAKADLSAYYSSKGYPI